MALDRKLTQRQKLAAFAFRFYQHAQWIPKVGDYYTTTRDDLMLFQIVRQEGQDWVVKCSHYEMEDIWAIEDFTVKGFGPCRMWVPNWIFETYPDDAVQSSNPNS
jgi:hypothetical protein